MEPSKLSDRVRLQTPSDSGDEGYVKGIIYNDAIAVQSKQSSREEIKDQLARDLNTIAEEPVGYEMVYGNSRGNQPTA